MHARKLRSLSFLTLLTAHCLLLTSLIAGDAVTPSSVAFNWFRDEGVGQISDQSYYDGTSLLLNTNCALYAGTTTNAGFQGLNNVTMELRLGNTTTNIVYTPVSTAASNGYWSCTISVPSNITPCYLQMKITDTNSNVYIYPWKTLNWKTPLK